MNEIDEILDEAKISTVSSESEGLPESPNSVNIKVWIKGYGVQFTMRDNKMNNVVKKVEYIIGLAEEKGWKSTWDTNVPKTGNTVSQGGGLCGIHGTPMVFKEGVSKKTGKPYAFWGCDTKNADGSFCSFKPQKGTA
jgi:hypothetical protein